MKVALIEELAATWEVMAATEDGSNPARRATLRECADAIRMLTTIPDNREQEMEDLLRSACAIADRHGVQTAWERFGNSIRKLGLNGITARTYRDLDARSSPAWDVDATARLRSIVDLLGLQASVPASDLTGYEFAVLGIVRREIEHMKSSTQTKLERLAAFEECEKRLMPPAPPPPPTRTVRNGYETEDSKKVTNAWRKGGA